MQGRSALWPQQWPAKAFSDYSFFHGQRSTQTVFASLAADGGGQSAASSLPRLHPASVLWVRPMVADGEGRWLLTVKVEQSAIPGRSLPLTALKVAMDTVVWGCVSLPPHQFSRKDQIVDFQTSAFIIQSPAFIILQSAFIILQSAFIILQSAFIIESPAFIIYSPAFIIESLALIIKRPAFMILQSAFII
jgi:hypothetical protein